MPKQLNLFRGSIGINNKVDPTRLQYNPESGIEELAAAVNVDVSSSKRVSRRKGYTLQLAQAAHSLFPCDGYCLFVSGEDLYVLESDYTSSGIRNLTTGARMSYVRPESDTYYCNGTEKGIVRDRISYAWTAASYVGPPTTKTFSDPPIGHLLEVYNGVMLIAQDNIMWHSEPFAYSWFDLAKNYVQFGARLTMMKAVQGGVFVSTEEGTFFHKGGTVKEFIQGKVADYPAIEGTAVTVNASRIGDGGISGLAAIWASKNGICFGGPDGSFRNLTERRLDYPAARYGAGLCRDGKYICLLKP